MRLDAHAVAAARRPLMALAALVGINLALLPVLIAAGMALGDQAAEPFFIAAFVVALASVLRRQGAAGAAPAGQA